MRRSPYTPYSRQTLAVLNAGYQKLNAECVVYKERFGKYIPYQVYIERHNVIFGERYPKLFSWKEMRNGAVRWLTRKAKMEKTLSQYEIARAIVGSDFETWPLRAYWHMASIIYNKQLRIYYERFGQEMPLALSNQLWKKQVNHFCQNGKPEEKTINETDQTHRDNQHPLLGVAINHIPS